MYKNTLQENQSSRVERERERERERWYRLPMVEAIIDERSPKTHEKGKETARARVSISPTFLIQHVREIKI
jgi:hypothetical protein